MPRNTGSPRNKTAARARKTPAPAPPEPLDVLSWTDDQRELHRAIAEVHQLAAKCRLAEIVRELMPEARDLAARGRPRLLATLARILSDPALSAAPPPLIENPQNAGDDGPMRFALVHSVARPINSLEQLNEEQRRLDVSRARLLKQ